MLLTRHLDLINSNAFMLFFLFANVYFLTCFLNDFQESLYSFLVDSAMEIFSLELSVRTQIAYDEKCYNFLIKFS